VMTRHNIGFEILDQISENYEVKFESRRFGNIIKLKKSGKSLIFNLPQQPFTNFSFSRDISYLSQSILTKSEPAL